MLRNATLFFKGQAEKWDTHTKKSIRDGEMGKKTEIQERGNHRETE